MSISIKDANELRHAGQAARIEIAQKVGRILVRHSDDSESEDALELAKLLAEDVAVSVREALSLELRNCSFLPKDLIVRLAQDIDRVATPFLMASQAMDDTFLEDIVRSSEEGVQEAIALRQGLSEAVSYAISDVGSVGAVTSLVGNDTVELSERSCNRVVDRFPEERSLMEKLAQRADLPASIVERVIFKISKRYGEYLSEKFGLATDYASYLVSMANRQVFSRTLEMAPPDEIRNYLSQLNEVGGLTSDVLLSHLQNNNIKLFTMALAVLLEFSYEAVETKVSLGDEKIVARLLEAAGFSKSVIGVLLIAYDRLMRGH